MPPTHNHEDSASSTVGAQCACVCIQAAPQNHKHEDSASSTMGVHRLCACIRAAPPEHKHEDSARSTVEPLSNHATHPIVLPPQSHTGSATSTAPKGSVQWGTALSKYKPEGDARSTPKHATQNEAEHDALGVCSEPDVTVKVVAREWRGARSTAPVNATLGQPLSNDAKHQIVPPQQNSMGSATSTARLVCAQYQTAPPK